MLAGMQKTRIPAEVL